MSVQFNTAIAPRPLQVWFVPIILCRQYLLKHSYLVFGVHLEMCQLCKQGSAQGGYGADAAVLGFACIEGPEGNHDCLISQVPAEEEPHFTQYLSR